MVLNKIYFRRGAENCKGIKRKIDEWRKERREEREGERAEESESDEQLSRHEGTFTSIHGIADVSK